MTQVRTRDEAIAAVDQAILRWATDLTGLLAQAQNVAAVSSAGAERVVRKCASEVAAIEAMVASARDEQRAELQAQLKRATDARDRAARSSAQIREIEARLTRLIRTVSQTTSSQVPEARAQLTGMVRALGGYRASATGFGDSGGPRGAGIRGTAASGIQAAGLSELDVSAADLTDNPILDDAKAQGTFGKGGLSRADYRWAVQTWNDVVGPGVAGGKTRDDFVRRDTQSNAAPLRRTADVYDMFLGSDRIRVDRQSDGSLNIINGRHRFQIARELGIKTLPGQVSG